MAEAPRPSPSSSLATFLVWPQFWTCPASNGFPPPVGSSFCPENEQIELALKSLIGVGFPFPVISPANAAVGVTTIATTTAAAAMSFLMLLPLRLRATDRPPQDRKSTRLNSSHLGISYAVFC